MQMNQIGGNSLAVSRIGIGCWAFGGGAYWGQQSQRDVERVVRAALDSGVNFFDTARMYNDGESEKALGTALTGVRHQAVVCSKVSPAKAYAAALRSECEQSLRNLGTDYLDLYMLHWPINPAGIRHFTDDEAVIAHPPTAEEAFATLAALQKEGKIREIGLSNHGLTQMEQALALCPGVAANELPYSLISRAIEAEILPFCRRQRVGVIASMTLAQGVLAGIYAKPEDVRPHQAHSRHFAQERGQGTSRHYENGAEEEVFATVDVLRALSAELGVTAAQLALAWVLQNQDICCALVGSRNEAQLRDNLAAAALVLPPDAVAQLDAVSQKVWDKLGNNPDYYENTSASRIY